MTAAGKITAANLREGSRIMVTVRLTVNQDDDAAAVVMPSATKRKNAHAATVLTITRNPAGTSYDSPGWVWSGLREEYVRGTVRRTRRRSDFDITVRIDRDSEPRTLENVTPSQTFWRA
jgi:hypothetical protein